MLEAELVSPAMHVVPVVTVIYDEAQENEDVAYTGTEQSDHQKPARKVASWAWVVLCLLIVILIGCTVLVPVLLLVTNSAGNGSEETNTSTSDGCFTSTWDIIQTQADASPEQKYRRFVICPNTRIKIGVVANPTENNTRFVHGDYPLMVLGSNVEVFCGEDGSLQNNCTFDGGNVQVLLQPRVPGHLHIASDRTDNVTIRGMTFTGHLRSDSLMESAGVAIMNPGYNVRLVDCLWENITAPEGLLFMGTSPMADLGNIPDAEQIYALRPRAAEAAIINSTFRHIVYDVMMMDIVGQSMSIQRCKFQDITISPYVTKCRPGPPFPDQWCHGLMFCRQDVCSMRDICVEQFEYAGLVPLLVGGYNSTVSLSGTLYTDQIHLLEQAREEAIDACDNSVMFAKLGIKNYEYIHQCVEDGSEAGVNWTRVSSCEL